MIHIRVYGEDAITYQVSKLENLHVRRILCCVSGSLLVVLFSNDERLREDLLLCLLSWTTERHSIYENH
jgi:hypothetical protein